MTYEICVPSRKRTKNMARILGLLPEARIYVAENEQAEYAQAVPEKQLKTHPNLRSLAAIRNHMLDACRAGVCIQIDDDFQSFHGIIGFRDRRYDASQDILTILENGAQALVDTGLTLYSFASVVRSSCGFYVSNPLDPLRLCVVGSSVLLIRKSGIKFDERFTTDGEDTDFALQCLLRDRAVICDQRFYANCGGYRNAKGGLQGKRTDERLAEQAALMLQKWGAYVAPKQKRSGMTYGPRVTRRNPLAREYGALDVRR